MSNQPLDNQTVYSGDAPIYGINGPVITIKGKTSFHMSEMVYVGAESLIGEIIALDKDCTTVQVFEDTAGLRPGDKVVATGDALSVTLAPGILNNIFDGIERPLKDIAEATGMYIGRGVAVNALDINKKWQTTIVAKPGDIVNEGTIIAEVPETASIVHKVMIQSSLVTPSAPYAFILKIIFTCLTLCAGYKGGEIVPSLCIGAAMGSSLSVLLGLPADICAACGMERILLSLLTMQAPTCVCGSFDRILDKNAMPIKYSSQDM